MSKELSFYDRVMLLNQIQVALVEFSHEPWLASLLLKESRWNVADYVHLVEKPCVELEEK